MDIGLYSSKLSPTLDIGVGVYLFVVALLSIVGNVLVLVMAYRRSSSMKPPELLSVNLAVTDLGAAISMYPLAVASAWNHRWLGGDATCVYYGLAGFFFGVASIMNLTVMAVVRFIVSINLQSTRERISRRTVKILCTWVWLYALTWALFPMAGWGRYGPEPFGLSCSLAWAWMKEDGFTFVVFIFVFNLALPSLVIIFCYFGITLKLFFTYRSSGSSRLQIPNGVKVHRRLLVIAILISAGFIVSWSPYGAVSMWYVLRDGAPLPAEVTLLPCMFAKGSTAYNPLIYYAFSKSFKREVKRLGEALCRVGVRAYPRDNNASVYVLSNQNVQDDTVVVGDTRLSETNRSLGAADAPRRVVVWPKRGAWIVRAGSATPPPRTKD